MILALLGCAFLAEVGGRGPAGDDTAGGDGVDTAETGGGGDTGGSGGGLAGLDCEDAPLVTWETFGEGFLLGACQPCHARTAAARHGAPANVAFDTEADAALWAERILARAAGDDADMPPAGGTTEEERYLLAAWLGCHPPSP